MANMSAKFDEETHSGLVYRVQAYYPLATALEGI